MASPNEYTPEQYRQAALKWAEKLGLMEWWPVIDWIATKESGWRGIQSTYPDLEGPGGFEDSWGPFQLNRAGVGANKEPKELLEPETNAKMALEYIKKGEYGLDKGYGIGAATQAWSVTHGVDMEWVNANPGQTPAPGQAGTPAVVAPVIGGVGGGFGEPDPEDSKYYFTKEQLDPTGGSPFVGLGQVGEFNRYLYHDDWAAYSETQKMQEGASGDEIAFINASVDLIAAQGAGVDFDIRKADLKLSKRLSALTEGSRLYRDLLPQSLPAGSKWIPGGEPGGLYEKLGLGVTPTATEHINPFATAIGMMGETPEMGATPDTSFEAAIAGGRQLREGMGATPTTAPVAAPSHLEMARETSAVAPSLSLADVVAGIGPGPMSTRLQPSVPPTFPAPVGLPPEGVSTPIRPEMYPPPGEGVLGPEVLSPEEAARIAEIVMAILGALGGGGGQSLATPTPTPPGAYKQALRGS